MGSVAVRQSGVHVRGMASCRVDVSVVACNVVHVALHFADEATQIYG